MTLKGKKVILRPIKLSDAARYVKWFNDEAVHKFLNIRHLTLKFERQHIKERLKNKSKTVLHFAIDTKEGRHIGSCSLEDINFPQKRATFGIMIGEKEFWSKGYGFEAASILLKYGFEKYKLNRVELDVYAYNKRAIALYRKLGFKKEGVKRKHAFWKGKFYDAYLMGLLKSEWEA